MRIKVEKGSKLGFWIIHRVLDYMFLLILHKTTAGHDETAEKNSDPNLDHLGAISQNELVVYFL